MCLGACVPAIVGLDQDIATINNIRQVDKAKVDTRVTKYIPIDQHAVSECPQEVYDTINVWSGEGEIVPCDVVKPHD